MVAGGGHEVDQHEGQKNFASKNQFDKTIAELGNTKAPDVMESIPQKQLESLNLFVERYWRIMEVMGHSGNSDSKAFEKVMYEIGRLKGFEAGVDQVTEHNR